MARPSHIIITAILFSLVGIGLFTFAGKLGDNYGKSLPSNYSHTQTQLNKLLSNTTGLGDRLEEKVQQSGGFSVTDAGIVLLGSIWSIIKMPIEMISFLSAIIKDIDMVAGLNIPSWFISAIISMIVVAIVFAILSAILKWRT